MSAAGDLNRRLVLSLATLTYAGVFAAFVIVEQPGLGIAHFFYVPICVVALSSNARKGAAAGVLAAALYATAMYLVQHGSSENVLTAATLIRLMTFTGAGVLIGWYANRNRTLVTELRLHANQDFLTGIGNARHFDEELEKRCGEARPFTVVLADLDDFGQVNDIHGHEAGNVALQRVADVLRENAGPAAVVARVGGDEFALITYRPSDQAVDLCNRLARTLVADNLHLSFGTTSYPVDGATPVELYRKADDRLFTAKLLNRNRRTVVSIR